MSFAFYIALSKCSMTERGSVHCKVIDLYCETAAQVCQDRPRAFCREFLRFLNFMAVVRAMWRVTQTRKYSWALNHVYSLWKYTLNYV